jgi:mono/diheme cytochrome c family protein
VFTLPAGDASRRWRLAAWTGPSDRLDSFLASRRQPVETGGDIRQGGRGRWKESVVTQVKTAPDTSAYVFDRLPLPMPNPWRRNVRVADVDFFDDGRAAVVTFDGDVWLISGVSSASDSLTWSRFASGLYEPLSLSIVGGEIFVFGREGIVRLHDLNNDGEADFYESFCDRIIQSIESREWAMDMVPRPEGGFYVAKGAALDAGPRTSDPVAEGFRAGSAHGGAVIEVSPDGEDVRVFASGFRQPFLGIHPKTGLLTASDQQGNFVPATPIYVVEEGGYYGVPASAHLNEPLPPPARPLTWIPHSADPSAAGQAWATGDGLGPLSGALIHFSYGLPGLFRAYVDSTGGVLQGAVSPLPGARDIPAMKGAVHPHDGLLYVAGFQIWQSRAANVSGLLRMRYTGLPSAVPTLVRAGEQGIVLRFDTELDLDAAQLPSNYWMRQWNYHRSPEYGSGHFRSDGAPGEEALGIAAAYASHDRKAVLLVAPGLDTLMQVRVDFDLKAASGERLQNAVFASMHEVRTLDLAEHGFPDVPWRRVAADFADAITVSDTSASSTEATAVFGRHLFHEIGCVGCHSIDAETSPGIAPNLGGLMDNERRLADGRRVVADSAYVVRSILDPSADVVEGYPANMPSYEGVLGDVEVASLLLFIRSLGGRDESRR